MYRLRVIKSLVVLISVFILVWVADPGFRQYVPVWMPVDALAAQILMLTAWPVDRRFNGK